jgi:hypothetical protein
MVSRRQTDYEDAAQILRGYKERIERLEEKDRGGDKAVQVFRRTTDTCLCDDAVSHSVGDGVFHFGQDAWGYESFGRD